MGSVATDIEELANRMFDCANSLEQSLTMLLWQNNLERNDIILPLEELRKAITSLENAEEYLEEYLQEHSEEIPS